MLRPCIAWIARATAYLSLNIRVPYSESRQAVPDVCQEYLDTLGRSRQASKTTKSGWALQPVAHGAAATAAAGPPGRLCSTAQMFLERSMEQVVPNASVLSRPRRSAAVA